MFIKKIDLNSPFGSKTGLGSILSPYPTILYLQQHMNALVIVVALLGLPWILHDSYALVVLVDF
jgi:hypothetical protein